MKTLRKSLNAHKDHPHISTPLPTTLSKPIGAIQPPKKVIKALASYKASAPQELSFEKGDFFHVANDHGHGEWYEAHNPMSGARGLVPSRLFEEFSKGAAKPQTPKAISPPPVRAQSPTSPKTQAFYAVVLHDFSAERADELDARAGDAITVVAQSNREWFVAKPIGRLGRPGLIPVTFVEIRDPGTGQPIRDVNALIDGGTLPRVEDWKRAVLSYKANSISLGVIEDTNPQMMQYTSLDKNILSAQETTPQSSQQQARQQQAHADRPPSPKPMTNGILLSADVKSFHFEMEEYWFRVHAIFQPYPPSSSQSLPPAKQLVLFRSYNDFYDFQVELLDTFPHEAGRPDKNSRILPYMPGPVQQVDNEITNTRRQELDEYLHQLCALKHSAEYILEHRLVAEFLSLKPGDAEVDIEPRIADIKALPRSFNSGTEPDYRESTHEQLSQMRISEGPDHGSDGSDYEEEGDVMGRGYDGDSYNYQSNVARTSMSRELNAVQPLKIHRPQSSISQSRSPRGASLSGISHSRSSSRTNSPLPPVGDHVHQHGRSRSSLETDHYHTNSHSRSSVASSHEPSPVSMRSSQTPSVSTSATSLSGRSRSQSVAMKNAPPISATNPQTAFVKIKIFDRMTDDLVAIRVHPRVTHAQLMDKVQSRLGGNVSALRYRDSMNNEFVGLENDEDLRAWLDSTDRLVLYTD